MPAILRTVGGLATKVIGPNGVVSAYDTKSDLTGRNIVVPFGLDAQVQWLAGQVSRQAEYFVPGRVRPGRADNATIIRRRYLERLDGRAPDILDERAEEIFVDCDGVRGVVDFRVDPVRAAESVRDLLPELAGVACAFAGSSKAGRDELVRGKYLFSLEEPMTMAALRAWGRDANLRAGHAVVDPSLYKPTQPTYLARPLFVDGAVDPMPERVLRLGGEDRPIVLPEPAAVLRFTPRVGPPLPSGQGWRTHLDDIGSLGARWREPLLKAAGAFAREHASPEAAMVAAEAAWDGWLGGWLQSRASSAEAAVRAGEPGWTMPSRDYDRRHWVEMVRDCARRDQGSIKTITGRRSTLFGGR